MTKQFEVSGQWIVGIKRLVDFKERASKPLVTAQQGSVTTPTADPSSTHRTSMSIPSNNKQYAPTPPPTNINIYGAPSYGSSQPPPQVASYGTPPIYRPPPLTQPSSSAALRPVENFSNLPATASQPTKNTQGTPQIIQTNNVASIVSQNFGNSSKPNNYEAPPLSNNSPPGIPAAPLLSNVPPHGLHGAPPLSNSFPHGVSGAPPLSNSSPHVPGAPPLSNSSPHRVSGAPPLCSSSPHGLSEVPSVSNSSLHGPPLSNSSQYGAPGAPHSLSSSLGTRPLGTYGTPSPNRPYGITTVSNPLNPRPIGSNQTYGTPPLSNYSHNTIPQGNYASF